MLDGTAFVPNILMKLKSAHIKHIILDNKMCTRYQLLERIYSVTPLYRGLCTTVSKKVINKV